MENITGIELENRYVILNPIWFKEPFVFLCEGGFGTSPDALGSAIGGKFLADGETARIERYQVLRLATDEEIMKKKVSESTLIHMLLDANKAYRVERLRFMILSNLADLDVERDSKKVKSLLERLKIDQNGKDWREIFSAAVEQLVTFEGKEILDLFGEL